MKGQRITAFAFLVVLFGFSLLFSAGCGGSSSGQTTPTDNNNPVPSLRTLSVSEALIGSQDVALTVSGTNFITGTKVSFGSNVITPSLVTATDMTITVPSALLTAAQIVPITASNPTPGGGTSNSLNFTIKNPLPTLTTLSQTTAYIGGADFPLELDGKGFVSGARVHFGGTDLNPSSVADTKLAVTVPATLLASTGTVQVSVSNPEPGGGASATLDFTIGNPIPVVTAFVEPSTLVNSTSFVLQIDGKGFAAGARVHFGSDDLQPASTTDTHLTVSIPDTLLTTAKVVPVTVSNAEPLGGTSNALEFTVANPLPQLTALSLDALEAGLETDQPLSVTGTGFIADSVVNFGSRQYKSGSPKSEQLDITLSATDLQTGGMVSVTVTNPAPGGGTSNAVMFRLNNPVPELASLSQTSAVAGDPAFELSLSGNKFVAPSTDFGGTTVDFGGTMLTPASVSKTGLVVSIPETAFATGGVISVKVINPEPGGGPSGSIDFTVNNPVPTITSASPTSITNTGSDISVSLLGSGFVSTSTVSTGDNSASSTWVSKSELNVTLPADVVKAGAATGSLSLTVSNPAPSGGTSAPFTLIIHDKANLVWNTLANGSSTLPGTTTPFESFSSASINASGMAVFRGKSVLAVSDGTGESSATTGIYTANLASGGALTTVADIATLVPDPNTLTYGSSLAKFGSFPSTPNIDPASSFVGFNATHPPVISLLPDGKGGSAGIYSNPGGTLDTGVGLFVTTSTSTYSYFQVPDMPAGTAFGAFPSAPVAVGGNTLVFKGDFLNGTAVGMGVYYRDVVASSGESPVTLIASTYSSMMPPDNLRKFGYIGAPAATSQTVVFVGYDRKDAPGMGGIYSAPLAQAPALTALVSVGQQVPGEADGVTFAKFADQISFDGRYVAFWGSWGTDTTTKHLTCQDNSEALLADYCLTLFPNGQDVQVPLHQGVFVYDTTQSTLTAVAKTGPEFSDFAYYSFVGTLPEEGAPTDTGGGSGKGGGDTETEVPLEPSGFVLWPNVAVAGSSSGYQLAYKANTGGVDGIYIASGTGTSSPVNKTAVDTTMLGTILDYNAASTTLVKSLDLGRAGMNGTWLTIGSTLTDSTTQTSSPGLYYTVLSSSSQ